MNWYKIANPLLEDNPTGAHYLDIGHQDEGKEYLWAIGNDFVFKKKDAEMMDTHTDWLDDNFWFDGFAVGRYGDGKVSLQLQSHVLTSLFEDRIINRIISY